MPPDNPLVSVVMPCFNAEAYVREAIGSVLSQSYENLELLFVDDGSTDASVGIATDLAKQSRGRVTILHTRREGPYPARNLALSRAKGEFVAFLDADDYWSPDFVQKMLPPLLDRDAAALTYCGWQNFGATARASEPFVPPDYESDGKVEMFLRSAAPWPIHAALVRKSVLDAAGGFDTNFTTCMDYDLWLRIGTAHAIVRVPEVLAFYRHHDRGQITSKQWRQAENVWLVKKKFVAASPALVARIARPRLKELIDGSFLRRGYDCYWRRDLVSARRIFRRSLRTGGWKLKDLKYLLPALLPEAPYLAVIGRADRRDVQH